MTVHTAVGRLVDALPHGRSIPPAVWRARHRTITLATVTAALLLAGFGLVVGATWLQALAASVLPSLVVVIARSARWSQRVRASLVAIALMAVAATAVHLSGTIEAHFLFFLAVPVVAFYEDWVPFTTSVGIVLLHHLVVGLLDPGAIYDHGAALQAPLRWGAIHVGLFLAMCAISLVHWRMHERDHSMLAQQAFHDPLTGLANRTLLLDRLDHALEDRTRTGSPVSVLTLDLDGFKPVNDTFGHQAGDTILEEIALRLRAAVRPGDTPARPGGDEFTVVLPGASSIDAMETARRLVEVIATPVTVGEERLSVGASIGVVSATTPSDTARTLLDRADVAMLTAKRNGRGTCTRYHPELDRNGGDPLLVASSDATAWADYMAELRAEIGERMDSGDIPSQTRAPDSVLRTLNVLVTEIAHLPADDPVAHLVLPERTSLAEFVFHQTMVHGWADGLVDSGVLSTGRSRPADRFWSTLHNHVTDPGRGTPPTGAGGGAGPVLSHHAS